MSAAQFRPGRFRPILTMLLVLVVLFVAWLGLEVYFALTARPNPATDYGALAEAHVRAYQGEQADEDGWPVLREAMRIHEESLAQLRDNETGFEWSDGDYEFDALFAYEEYLSDLKEEEEADASFERSRYDKLDAQRRMSEAALRAWPENGIAVKLDEVIAGRRAVRPIPDSMQSILIGMHLSELSSMRSLARALRASMTLARDDGDWEGYARALERGLALGRIGMEQSTIIDRLVGGAIRSLMLDQVREDLTALALPASALGVVRGAIDRQSELSPLSHTLDAELLTQLDAVQWTHDRRGRLLLDRVHELDGSGTSGVGAKVVNLASIAFPRQRTTEAWFRAKNEQVKAMVALSVRERREAERRGQLFEVLDRVEWSQPLGRVLLPAYGSIVRADDQLALQTLGVRVMLTVEEFRQETGRLPAELGELVPRWLDAQPEDPFAEIAAPLVYRVLEAEGEAESAYILYSVGYDGADHGGTPSERNALDALREGYAGTDFILSGTGE